MKKLLLITLSFFCLQTYAQNSNADYDYQQAVNHFKNGYYDKALESLTAFIGHDGDDTKAKELRSKVQECKEVYVLADELYINKKYAEALSQYENLKKLNPTHIDLDKRISNCRTAIDNANRSQSQTVTPKTQVPYQSTSSSTSSSSSSTYSRSSNPLKPESFTMELGVIGGTNLGAAIDFTVSYFLIGVGVDWIMITPEKTKTTNLVNSGYTGNFTKQTTYKISGSCTNVFLDLGGYFKYFSVSCQVGLLCGTTIERSSLYNGSGYGLVDGDLNEYWGSYSQRSLTNSTSNKELHLTLTPQIKGYIPFGRGKDYSISLGLGYTFIPTLDYYAGLSGNLGFHIRF